MDLFCEKIHIGVIYVSMRCNQCSVTAFCIDICSLGLGFYRCHVAYDEFTSYLCIGIVFDFRLAFKLEVSLECEFAGCVLGYIDCLCDKLVRCCDDELCSTLCLKLVVLVCEDYLSVLSYSGEPFAEFGFYSYPKGAVRLVGESFSGSDFGKSDRCLVNLKIRETSVDSLFVYGAACQHSSEQACDKNVDVLFHVRYYVRMLTFWLILC